MLSPNNADALALSSIIAIVQNERETGLVIAQEAVAMAPDAAGPNLAFFVVLASVLREPAAQDLPILAMSRIKAGGAAYARAANFDNLTMRLVSRLKPATNGRVLSVH